MISDNVTLKDNSRKVPDVKSIKTKIAFKTRFIYFLILSLASVCAILYLFIKTTSESKLEYNQGIEYLETLGKVQERCTDVLTQESGNFGDYDYCRQFMQTFPKSNMEETSD